MPRVADARFAATRADPFPTASATSVPLERHIRGRVVAVVAVCTAIGLALRMLQAGQDLFADELSTYWIVTTHPLGDVIATVRSNAEISPPLSFVVSWLMTRIGVSTGWLRLASVIAGTVLIPLVYAIGARSVGRAAALVAAAITAVAPLQIYYSGEARAYALLVTLVALSTSSLLRALDLRSRGAWLLYGLSICGAAYTHYTCVFVLATQAAWLWWAHPETRSTSLLVHSAAALAYVLWIPGLVADLRSPTLLILSVLHPFDAHHVGVALAQAAVGHPYARVAGLGHVPGPTAFALLGLGFGLSLVSIALRRRAPVRTVVARGGRRTLLVLLLAVATPVGAGLESAFSQTTLFAARNLVASWPGLALAIGALVSAAGPQLRALAAVLVVAAYGIGGAKLLEPRYERPHLSAAAAYVEASAAPDDVVIDETLELSPGPLSHLDPVLRRGLMVERSSGPAERDHPFTVFDPVVEPAEAARRAVDAARGSRIFVVGFLESEKGPAVPGGYRLREERRWPGLLTVVVRVYEVDRPAS